MAKMTSMSKDESEYSDYVSYDKNKYPYGLCLHLCSDDCEKLGIDKALKAGTQITLSANAIVTSSRESLESGESNDISLDLQIIEMSVTPKGVLKDAASVLYGDD